MNPTRRLSPHGVVLLLTLCVAAPASAQDEIYGKQTYVESKELAEELAQTQPGTTWETQLDGEAADLLEFIGEDLLLVGLVEVNRNADPKHGRLHLFDLASGRQRWRTDRRDMKTGGYDLIATEPWLLLRGSDGEETRLTALELESGDREWEIEMGEPSRMAVLPGGERVLLLDRDGDGARLRMVGLRGGDEMWSSRVPASLVA